jgi:hypothetical protein
MLRQRELYVDYVMREGQQAFQSDLFTHARRLVRHADETKKPNPERLREYTDARLPALTQQLLDPAPVDVAFDEARLAWSLARLREVYGADDAFVKKALAGQAPEDRARALVTGSKLGDPAVRKAALEGAALDDPMLAFARLVDPEARAVRKRFEDEVEAAVKRSGERLAEARRAVLGTSGAPDATFTLRLSFGRVQGVGDGPAMTTVKGLFERASGRPPYAVTERWLAAKAKLPPATPYNVATTNDIIGGNSGSPLLDRRGDVVGLVFDGNLASLGGNFGYEPETNRAVAVHGDLILLALEKVYGAGHVAAEVRR